MARAAAQPKYAPRRPTRALACPFCVSRRRASDGLSPQRAEGPREKVALCAKNGCEAQAKATQRTTRARRRYPALQQAVSGSRSAHRRRKKRSKNGEAIKSAPANQERAKKLGRNSIEKPPTKKTSLCSKGDFVHSLSLIPLPPACAPTASSETRSASAADARFTPRDRAGCGVTLGAVDIHRVQSTRRRRSSDGAGLKPRHGWSAGDACPKYATFSSKKKEGFGLTSNT